MCGGMCLCPAFCVTGVRASFTSPPSDPRVRTPSYTLAVRATQEAKLGWETWLHDRMHRGQACRAHARPPGRTDCPHGTGGCDPAGRPGRRVNRGAQKSKDTGMTNMIANSLRPRQHSTNGLSAHSGWVCKSAAGLCHEAESNNTRIEPLSQHRHQGSAADSQLMNLRVHTQSATRVKE